MDGTQASVLMLFFAYDFWLSLGIRSVGVRRSAKAPMTFPLFGYVWIYGAGWREIDCKMFAIFCNCRRLF